MRVTMSTVNKMRDLATIAGTSALMIILSSNAAHALRATKSLLPRYCFNLQGHHHCGFHTWEQCQAARHGLGGGCHRQPGT
jgi:hypothetical protein